jgi:hypothetical protein
MRTEEIVKFGSGAAVTWPFLRDDGTPAALFHRCCRGEMWRESSLVKRVGFVATLLSWPLLIPILVAFFTWRNGPGVRQRIGKSIARQMWEQIGLTVTRSTLPPWYYIFELHDDDKRRRAGEYLHRFETKRFAYEFLRRYNGGQPLPTSRSTRYLSSKALFTERCRDYRLPAIPIFLQIEDGKIVQGASDEPLLPRRDLFCKLVRGTGGNGAERWAYLGDDRYQDIHGNILSEGELIEHLRALSLARRKGYIVQPRLVNHDEIADLSNGSLTTVRVMTCRNENGEYEVTNAAFRMAQGKTSVVDNFHAGGILARIDLSTGELGRATDGAMALGPGTGWCERHPDTGGQILGRKLPLWGEVLDLARRAHATAFSDQVVIGWDIGILGHGPRLVEGNKGPDLDLVQRSHAEPLGNSRLGELMVYNMLRSLETKYSEGAPIARAVSEASSPLLKGNAGQAADSLERSLSSRNPTAVS